MTRTFRLPDYLWIKGSDLTPSGPGFCEGCALYADALYWPPDEEGSETRALCERCTARALCESCAGTGRVGEPPHDTDCPDCWGGDVSRTYPIEIAGRHWATDGLCLVAEGEPLPEQWTDPEGVLRLWLTSAKWAKSGHKSQSRAVAMLSTPWSPGLTTPALDSRVHRRFGSLLRRGSRLDLYTEQDPRGGERSLLVRAFRGDTLFFVCVVLHHSYTSFGLSDQDKATYPTVRELVAVTA